MNTSGRTLLVSWFLPLTLSIAGAAPGCITLERENPGQGDIAIDTTQPDGTGGDTAPDIGPPDVGSDTPSCKFACTEPETLCTFWACNPASGQCEEIDKPDDTECGGPCAPALCSSGECLGLPTTSGPGSCSGSGECGSSPCGTFSCNLDSCMCELTQEGDGPFCCSGGSCDHLGGPIGCAASYCEPTSNECVSETWVPADCQCETELDCGPSEDPCAPWVCDPIEGCVQQEIPDCEPCFGDPSDCVEAALAMGGCFEGNCTEEGICEFIPNPGCESCVDEGDCAAGTLCDTVTCSNGACGYATDPTCMLCNSANDCPAQAPDCYVYWCPAGVCELFEQTNCSGGCTEDGDCEDGDPCTVDTCVSGGMCESAELPVCAAQNCSNQDAASPSVVANATAGSLVKVAGEPALDIITGQQVTTCGDQDDTIDIGPVAISDASGVVNTMHQGASAWQCNDICGNLTCIEPIVGIRYWVWGTLGAEATPVVDVAGWCLEMEAANIVGNYAVTLSDPQSGDPGLSGTASIGQAGAFLVMTFGGGLPLTASGVVLDPAVGELIFILDVGAPWSGTGTAMLTGSGNTLSGTVIGDLGSGFQTLDISLTRF